MNRALYHPSQRDGDADDAHRDSGYGNELLPHEYGNAYGFQSNKSIHQSPLNQLSKKGVIAGLFTDNN